MNPQGRYRVIGVTGHRQLDDDTGIRSAARAVLEAIGCDSATTVVSPIAEGADRLIAEEAIALHAGLVAVLPFPPDRYALDFPEAASRQSFQALLAVAADIIVVAPQPTDEDAYLAAGRAIVDRSDVMVAVWDGLPARGRGGTAEVVQYAATVHVPVIWIDAGSEHQVAILGTRDATSDLAGRLPIRPEE